VMHMQGTPETMQRDPDYNDIVGNVKAWLAERVTAAEAAGVAREQLIVDPGIGFGKTLEHNLALMARLAEFRVIAGGVLLGASRKSWLEALSGAAPELRLPGSLAAATAGALTGADIVRVHDVAATRQAMDVANTLREFK